MEKKGADEMKITWQKIGWSSFDWIGMFRPHTLDAELYIAKFNVKGMRRKGGRKERMGGGERKQKSPCGIINVPFSSFSFLFYRACRALGCEDAPSPMVT